MDAELKKMLERIEAALLANAALLYAKDRNDPHGRPMDPFDAHARKQVLLLREQFIREGTAVCD
jgi:hypothetical protein